VPATAPNKGPYGPKATRRIAKHCDPVAEAKKYEELIVHRVLVFLSWNNASERAAKLEIPAYVTAVVDDVVVLRILEFPLREQYIAVWLESGHIQPAPANSFLLDPCSARIEDGPR
jgi:hypothetical protein